MPKKAGRRPKTPPNKAEAIRNYKRQHPDSKPKEISEVLNKQGIDVNPQYVSMILSTERRKKGEAKPRRARDTQISVDDLMVAKNFVKKMGGVDAARAAVEAFDKIASGS